MFVWAFNNGIMLRHFYESLNQRLTAFLVEVVTQMEYHIKGEENNVEKKAWDENNLLLIHAIHEGTITHRP